MELAIASGSTVVVIFVHRHPVESYLQGVLPRTLEEGRTLSIAAHLRMHRDSQKTFLRVQRTFAENSKSAFRVFNNTGHATEAFPADVSYLKGVKHDQEEMFKAIKEGLDHAYRPRKSPRASIRRHAAIRKASQMNMKRLPRPLRDLRNEEDGEQSTTRDDLEDTPRQSEIRPTCKAGIFRETKVLLEVRSAIESDLICFLILHAVLINVL